MKKLSARHATLKNLEIKASKILAILEHHRLRSHPVTLPVQRIIFDSYGPELESTVKLYLKEYELWLKEEVDPEIGTPSQDRALIDAVLKATK